MPSERTRRGAVRRTRRAGRSGHLAGGIAHRAAAGFAPLAILLLASSAPRAAEVLGRFSISEPLGIRWADEWLERDLRLDLGRRPTPAGALRLRGPEGGLPAQFYREGRLLGDSDLLEGTIELRALFRATVEAGKTAEFEIVEDRNPPAWPRVRVEEKGDRTAVSNGVFEIELDRGAPLPWNSLRPTSGGPSLGRFVWPPAKEPTGCRDSWIERGPARAIVRRIFRFEDPELRYEIEFDIRAGDPWIDISERYALGRGAAIVLDLRDLDLRVVYHLYAYNARTFGAGGPEEDSTLEPPQHPIATLGPIWRDIWFGGGPFAYLYRPGENWGIGFAAVRGSEWDAPDGIPLESQNLEIHGDRTVEGRVVLHMPADAGKRRWAAPWPRSPSRRCAECSPAWRKPSQWREGGRGHARMIVKSTDDLPRGTEAGGDTGSR